MGLNILGSNRLCLSGKCYTCSEVSPAACHVGVEEEKRHWPHLYPPAAPTFQREKTRQISEVSDNDRESTKSPT